MLYNWQVATPGWDGWVKTHHMIKGYRRIQSKVVIGIITAIFCKNRRDSASIVQRSFYIQDILQSWLVVLLLHVLI